MKLASVFVAAAMTISATPISGTLNFTGNAQVSATTINFRCDLLGVCDGSNGDFFITGGSANSGLFATISVLNRFGQVEDIVSPALDVPISIPDFATFLANPDIVLDITKVFSGTGSSCPPVGSQTCTPPDSPLNILQTPTGAAATFSVLANARRISTGEISSYKGLFTIQATQAPSVFQSGAVNASYSATFSPFNPVPEPGYSSLLGLLFLGLLKRKLS